MALSANALTSVTAVKEYLKIDATDTSQDSLFEALINASSNVIENYCNRSFIESTYTDEEYDGKETSNLILKNFPVYSVTSIKIDDVLVDSTEYKVRKDSGIVVRLNSVWPAGIMNIKVTYTAGYTAIPADVELACKHLVMFFYKMDVADFGRTFGEGIVLRPEAIPPQIRIILGPYRRVLV
ncbi:head-tail connector protein [Tepidibacillus decaturensis]|uniref:Phage gp6-like head-tail connector protein n=1 Tax=Tepidibacillus decaturensis TaxID=1413211 RepID=A0A135L1H8_9BACI|nr:head-tail connector protein [Tepidibacillus decaturensis]KXG42874.1 hypothetical protein U473_01640 [Tepidibacillus decaturensis]